MKRIKPVSILVALIMTLALLPAVSAHAETDAGALLNSIDLLARQGWILNCGYRLEENTVDDVTDDIGMPDKTAYVESAKGTYATFDQALFAVGFNKGDQLFELQSFDARLGGIKLSDVKAFYGEPDHKTTGSGEQHLSYRLTDKLNIKFIFSSSGKNPALKHYNVLWPEGTANLMAGDPGRTW